MPSLWWSWDKITTLDSTRDLYNALAANKSYHNVRLQHSGDVVATKGSVTVGVILLNASVPYIAPPPPPPPNGGGQQVGMTSSYGGGPSKWWRGIACSGASKSEAETIFREIRTLKLQQYATL